MRTPRLFAVGLALTLLLAAVQPLLAQSNPTRIAATQVTVAATATITAIARTNRASVTIQNHGTVVMYCGPDSTVLTTTGFRIPGVDGASITILGTSIVYCLTTAGTQVVSVLESF